MRESGLHKGYCWCFWNWTATNKGPDMKMAAFNKTNPIRTTFI